MHWLRARQRQKNCCLSVVFCTLFSILTYPSRGSADPTLVCDGAARHISKESGVPLEVLRTITRTETGRGTNDGMKPWPWTVNMEGKGVWFDTQEKAYAYVFRHFKSGARSFDIGCFQINYRWHGHAFKSIEEMFDPIINARYAAKFLRKLHVELGDWNRAVGAYHSRTHKHATRYLNRYTEVRAALDNAESLRTGGSNQFPLIRTTPTPSLRGSLVPLNNSQARSIFKSRQGG